MDEEFKVCPPSGLQYSNGFLFAENSLTLELLSMVLTAVRLLEQSLHWIVTCFIRNSVMHTDRCRVHL